MPTPEPFATGSPDPRDLTGPFRHELEIQVRDDGAGGPPGDGGGLGLAGIRERVKIYGGEMNARKGPEGGFVLTARLPVDEGRP